jgi:hypothetical protein
MIDERRIDIVDALPECLRVIASSMPCLSSASVVQRLLLPHRRADASPLRLAFIASPRQRRKSAAMTAEIMPSYRRSDTQPSLDPLIER